MVVFMIFDPDRVEELGGLSAAERFCCLSRHSRHPTAAVGAVGGKARFHIGLDFHDDLLR
jgi:hypothetical protein